MEFITAPSELNQADAFIAPPAPAPVAEAPKPAAKTPAKKQNPDVRAFTGYIACDGSTHKSAGEAIKHSEAIKVKAALDAVAEGVLNDQAAYVTNEGSGPVIAAEDLPEFLLAYRAQILAAFSQTVKMRAPRGSKKTVVLVEAPAA